MSENIGGLCLSMTVPARKYWRDAFSKSEDYITTFWHGSRHKAMSAADHDSKENSQSVTMGTSTGHNFEAENLPWWFPYARD